VSKTQTAAEKLQRDIDTVMESIRRSWQEHASSLSAEDRSAIRGAIESLIAMLRELLEERDRATSKNQPTGGGAHT
jgi:hypothetical protein